MHWIDPNSVPEIEGIIERFTPNPKGKVDGLILTSGTFVHFPPHLADAVLAIFQQGDLVLVRGVRPRDAVDMVDAISLSAKDGRTVLDEGPPEHGSKSHRHAEHHAQGPKKKNIEAAGSIRRALHGPKGELRGALLQDGTVIRVAPKAAEHFADLLHNPGAPLAARGHGIELEGIGRAIEAHEIGLDLEQLQSVEPEKHKGPKHKGPKHNGPKHKGPDHKDPKRHHHPEARPEDAP